MSRLDKVGISCSVSGKIMIYRHGAGDGAPLETKDVTTEAIRTVVEFAQLHDNELSFEGSEDGKRYRYTLKVTQEEIPNATQS